MINKIKNRGFTLIETLIAVLILTTAIAGPLTIASKSLTAALVAKDQITAYYLAQDAVEYVRAKRDSACLASPSCGSATWLSTLAACISADGSALCYVDSIQDTAASSVAAGCTNTLRYHTANGYFSYGTTGTVCSLYTRTVSLTYPYNGRNDEAKLTVVVSWNDIGSNTHTITVSENLFNWQ